MKALDLQVVVYKEGRQYVAQCLNVDVSSFGATEAEALANIQEALELYLEDANLTTLSKVQKPALKSVKLQHA